MFDMALFVFFYFLIVKINSLSFIEAKDDSYKTLEQIVIENGYLCDSFEIETSDGYILSLYHIKRKVDGLEESNASANLRQPILLQHGLEADMMQWVYHTADKAPAFVLANAEYDVWLGNNRGTRFSLEHKWLDNNSKE